VATGSVIRADTSRVYEPANGPSDCASHGKGRTLRVEKVHSFAQKLWVGRQSRGELKPAKITLLRERRYCRPRPFRIDVIGRDREIPPKSSIPKSSSRAGSSLRLVALEDECRRGNVSRADSDGPMELLVAGWGR